MKSFKQLSDLRVAGRWSWYLREDMPYSANLQEALEIENQMLRWNVSGCPELGPWPESEEEADARIAQERATMVFKRSQGLCASDPEY